MSEYGIEDTGKPSLDITCRSPAGPYWLSLLRMPIIVFRCSLKSENAECGPGRLAGTGLC